MCPPRRPRRQSSPPPRSSVGASGGTGIQNAVKTVATPSTFVEAKAAQPAQPAPKFRTIDRTATGTSVSGQQTTSTAAPARRIKTTPRMGRRAGTRSLRISRNPNTGQGNLLY